MKTTTEKNRIKSIESEYRVTLEAIPETIRVRGNVLASGNDRQDREYEDRVLQRIEDGDDWAWFTAKVTVTDSDGRTASYYLGACSLYGGADEFKRGGYYLDMLQACLDELMMQAEAQ